MTDRQSTHGHFCWGWGQKHYECAVREIERLREQLRLATVDQATAEAEANDARAEIEAMRAGVERLTLEMRRLQQQYDERTACMIVHRGQALACSDAVHTAYSDERRRAERLAAALEAAREDAERWRALREMDGGEIYALLGDCDGIHPEQADAAIDQARGEAGQEVGE
jgi:DNA repair exonuclease SbcCD ATPase subunit